MAFFRNQASGLVAHSARPIDYRVSDNRVASTPHTHPSHTQNSRLLTSSLSLGVPVPHVIDPSVLIFSLQLHGFCTDTVIPTYVFPLPLALSVVQNKRI